MANDARSELRRIVSLSLDAFIRAVERGQAGGSVSVAEMRAIAASMSVSPALDAVIDGSFARLDEVMAEERLRQRRHDPFLRLLVHPFAPAFSDERLSRDVLPNFFSFIHLVMGDQVATLATRCQEIRLALEAEMGSAFTWDAFYDDPRALQVLWAVLVRIAATFRRFDSRREWFIGLMQYTPQAVSLSASAFVPTAPHADKTSAPPFGLAEFNVLFACLFAPLRRMTDDEMFAFQQDFGAPPDRLLGPLWEHLDGLDAF